MQVSISLFLSYSRMEQFRLEYVLICQGLENWVPIACRRLSILSNISLINGAVSDIVSLLWIIGDYCYDYQILSSTAHYQANLSLSAST